MSSDDRAVLIGMNNPYGADPKYALYPLPERATGWNIWSMLHDFRPDVGLSEYADAFDRRNLLVGAWSDRRARERAEEIASRRELQERTVLLFGARVRDAFRLPKTPCGSEARINLETLKFTYLHWTPHPSGLCQWYNIPKNRALVGKFLVRLYEGERGLLTINAGGLA